jgi:hypothetical protein
VIPPPFAPLAPVESARPAATPRPPAMGCGVPGCIVCRPPGKRMSTPGSPQAGFPAPQARFTCPKCGGPKMKAAEVCLTPACLNAYTINMPRRDSAGPGELRW